MEIKHKKYAIEKDEWLKIGDHFVQWMENSVAQVNGHSLSFAVAVDTVLIPANNFNQIKPSHFRQFQNYSLQSTRNRMEFYRSKEYSHTTHITYGSNCTFNRFFLYIFSSLLVAGMEHTKSVLINTHLGSFIHFRYFKMQFVCSFKWFWFLNRVFFWGGCDCV